MLESYVYGVLYDIVYSVCLCNILYAIYLSNMLSNYI